MLWFEEINTVKMYTLFKMIFKEIPIKTSKTFFIEIAKCIHRTRTSPKLIRKTRLEITKATLSNRDNAELNTISAFNVYYSN